MVVHVCNLSTWEENQEDPEFMVVTGILHYEFGAGLEYMKFSLKI